MREQHFQVAQSPLFTSIRFFICRNLLEGFGNAFQSANTTITIGGSTQVATTTVQRWYWSIHIRKCGNWFATLGKSWAQVAQTTFSTPTTVDVFFQERIRNFVYTRFNVTIKERFNYGR